MKKLLLATTLAILLGISGCSLFPQQYDNNEYELLARLDTSVSIISERCDDPSKVQAMLDTLEYDARLLHTYTFYIPQNTEVFGVADILKNDVAEFKAQYFKNAATPTYCKLKSRLLRKKIQTTLEVVAQKPRS